MSLILAGLDIETTGLLTPDHRILEVYIGLWRDGKKVLSWEQRIDPQREVAAEAYAVHHISRADVIGQPTFELVAPKIIKILSTADAVVAHNGEDFDWPFLQMEMKRVGHSLPDKPIFDTMKSGVWANPVGKMPRLQELCFACGIDYDPALAHAAAYDVDRMMECFLLGQDWGFFTLDSTEISSAA